MESKKIFKWKGKEYQLILLNLAGSRFYNTHYEKGEHPFDKEYVSDSDYRGIFIASQKDKLSLTKDYVNEIQPAKDDLKSRAEIISQINTLLNMNIPLDEDITLYEVEKFLKTSIENNPNIMDVLWSDNDSIFFKSKEAEIILNNKKLFTSQKIKDSFSGYALSQLYRIKSHHKMLTNNPEVNKVFELVQDMYNEDKINFVWIREHFSGHLAVKITNITQEEYGLNKKLRLEDNQKTFLTWDEFVSISLTKKYDIKYISNYKRPQLIDYIKVKDLYAKKLNIDNYMVFGNIPLREYMLKYATFRTLGESVYNIFTLPPKQKYGGLFSVDGNMKNNEPKEVGEFLGSIIVKKNDFKKQQDYIRKLWEWKCNRNEKRSELEKRFGYDVKHAGHLVRLLEGVKNIILTGEYKPRLEGDFLKFTRKIMSGHYSYEFLVNYAETKNKELEELFKSDKVFKIQKKVDLNKIEDLLKEILDISKY
jgi:hypothetical protein